MLTAERALCTVTVTDSLTTLSYVIIAGVDVLCLQLVASKYYNCMHIRELDYILSLLLPLSNKLENSWANDGKE